MIFFVLYDFIASKSAFGVNSAFGNPSQIKKKRFLVDKCDRGVFSTHCHNMKLRFQNEIAQPKIYKSPDMYFFLKLQQLCLYLALAR